MAGSIVYGGLYVLPSPTPSTATSSSLTSSNTNSTTSTSINNNLPHTFEGYMRFGYNSLSSWITPKSFVLEQQQRNNNAIEDTRSNDNTNVRISRDDDDDNDNEIIDLDLWCELKKTEEIERMRFIFHSYYHTPIAYEKMTRAG